MIEVCNLTKRFGACTAIENLSFRVERGESFALLGPNGSGKTTTLKCMVGLVSPTSGEVSINGINVARKVRESRKLFSYLPQRVAFPESVTAREVLEFYCRLRKLPSERVKVALSRAQFNGAADRLVSEFSGGMVQRLGVAVAFLPDAPLLVLDEPTLSLDPEGAFQLREFITSQKREGKTVVFASHVLSDVERLADRVAVLVGGKLVRLESVKDLQKAMSAGARLRLVLRSPSDKFVSVALKAGASVAEASGDSLIVWSKAEDRLAILRAVEVAGGSIERFSTEEPSLEEIYMGYVNEARPHPDGSCCSGLPEPKVQSGGH